jgi:hypothetical protein
MPLEGRQRHSLSKNRVVHGKAEPYRTGGRQSRTRQAELRDLRINRRLFWISQTLFGQHLHPQLICSTMRSGLIASLGTVPELRNVHDNKHYP